MAPRVTSELLLVGSLPADSTEAALQQGAEYFGDLVCGLRDGETRPRAAWVGYERERLARPNPDGFLDEFGVAMYCGFGRRPDRDGDGDETMRARAARVRGLLGG
jgi:hypothetical protein